MTNEDLTPADALRIQANLFRMVSGLFLAEPSRELAASLALEETWDLIGLFTPVEGHAAFRRFVQQQRPALEDLKLQFHALFNVPAGCYVFPFESCYRVAKPPGPLMGRPAVEVQSEYAAAGFAVAPELLEPPDHVGVELAFVAELLERRAAAVESGERESAEELAEQLRRFCTAHLNQWLPALLKRIRDGGSSDFYAGVAGLAAALVQGVLSGGAGAGTGA